MDRGRGIMSCKTYSFGSMEDMNGFILVSKPEGAERHPSCINKKHRSRFWNVQNKASI